MPKRYSPEVLEDIRKSVAAAEAATSGEIVPLITPASSSYFWVHPLLAFKGLLVAVVFVELLVLIQGWPVSALELVSAQALGALLGFALSFVPSVKRWSIGSVRMAERVHEKAMATFLAEGLTETKDRDGVLIYVSLLEHQVEILADRGIHAKVPKEFWKTICDELSLALKAGDDVAGMKRAIAAVGEKLKENFPRQPGDVNELSDEPRTRR